MALRRRIRKRNRKVGVGIPAINQTELFNRIQERAYSLYEKRGGTHGDDWADWFEAERQIRKELRLSW